MTETLKTAMLFAQSDFPVLITGESGTGKEVLAQSIHNESAFREGPFVALNCAALPEPLLEGELFGYDEGAFTGAKKGGKVGIFELSHNGTLFLDEVGELSVGLQAKLLRALQERSIRRVGGSQDIPVKNRLICATNQNLEVAVQEKRFRLDFYYRINVLSIKIPPLRDRVDDIPDFINLFIGQYMSHPFEDEAFLQVLFERLTFYDWPGNVRQLENVIKRICVMLEDVKPGETPEDFLMRHSSLMPRARGDGTESVREKSEESLLIQRGPWNRIERQIFLQMEQLCHGNMQMIARELQLAYSTVWRKMKEIRNASSEEDHPTR